MNCAFLFIFNFYKLITSLRFYFWCKIVSKWASICAFTTYNFVYLLVILFESSNFKVTINASLTRMLLKVNIIFVLFECERSSLFVGFSGSDYRVWKWKALPKESVICGNIASGSSSVLFVQEEGLLLLLPSYLFMANVAWP